MQRGELKQLRIALKRAKKEFELGRSMVEMLGVLAVIGVLSVAGIAGYTSAMNKHRANELMYEASKRIVLGQAQLAQGRAVSDISFDEFGNTPVVGATFETSALAIGTSTTTFGVKVSGVAKGVCKKLANMSGDKVRVRKQDALESDFTAASCDDSNALAFVFGEDDIIDSGYGSGSGSGSDTHYSYGSGSDSGSDTHYSYGSGSGSGSGTHYSYDSGSDSGSGTHYSYGSGSGSGSDTYYSYDSGSGSGSGSGFGPGRPCFHGGEAVCKNGAAYRCNRNGDWRWNRDEDLDANCEGDTFVECGDNIQKCKNGHYYYCSGGFNWTSSSDLDINCVGDTLVECNGGPKCKDGIYYVCEYYGGVYLWLVKGPC